MTKTVVFLILSLILVPIISFYYGSLLTPLQSEILKKSINIYLGVAMACFLLSEFTKNYSQVDKIWSVVPVVYAWMIAYWGGLNERLILMAILVTIWGIRLTYNFSRRGAYSWKFWEGEEDYRWSVLRAKPEFNSPMKWRLFNLFFISLYQNGLILLFTLPILLAVDNTSILGWTDYLFAVLIIIFIIFETIADQQQWNYQSEKYRQIKEKGHASGIYAKGFTHTGLWKVIRHPNYMAEQSIWICYYLLSAATAGQWINWTLSGSILLVLLFVGSSDFSESISANKYPAYIEYQKNTGRFFPRIF